MKKTILIIFSLICFILTSCTSNNKNDTYFIHAAAFDKSQDEYLIYAICEKAGEKQEKYFTAKSRGTSIRNATENLMDKYKDCYFATAEIYMIRDNSEKELIYDMAKEICGGNIYPVKSDIICIKDANLSGFISSIKSEDDLNKLKRTFEKRRVNAVKFFSEYISKKRISLPALTLDEEQNPKTAQSKEAIYNARSNR